MTTVERKDKGLVKNSYRGLTLDQLEKLNQEDLVALFRARLRRRFSRSKNIFMKKLSTSTLDSSTNAENQRELFNQEKNQLQLRHI
jgi:hypothetical protein